MDTRPFKCLRELPRIRLRGRPTMHTSAARQGGRGRVMDTLERWQFTVKRANVIRVPVAPGSDDSPIIATVVLESGEFTPQICAKLRAYLELLESALTEDEQRETTERGGGA